jgi:hypothetical protein
MLIIQNSDSSDNLQLFLLSIPNILLVIVTLGYVLLTIKLVKTNQALFDAQSEPILIAYLRLNDIEDPEHIDLIIENVGMGSARNIRFSMDPSNVPTVCRNLENHSLVQRGLSIIGPKQRLSIRLCIATGIQEGKRMIIPENFLPFQLIIKYNDSAGKEMDPASFDLDPNIFLDY